MERVKKYLRNLSTKDKKWIHEQAKANPDFIVQFGKQVKGQPRSIVAIKGNKNKIAKKERLAANNSEDLSWVIGKLSNPDPYFQLENQVYLLVAIFQNLID